MSEKVFDEFLLCKLKEFSLMYGEEKSELTSSGFANTTSVSKAWSDLVVKTCASYLGYDEQYETKDKNTFDIICNFWRQNPDIITYEECWTLVDLLEDKISGLKDSGFIKLNDASTDEISADIIFSLINNMFDFIDKNGGVSNGIGVCKPDFEVKFASGFDDIKTECFDAYFVFGLSCILCLTSAYRCSSAFSKIKILVDGIRTKPDEKGKNMTYLATDSTGLVKIGRSSDFKGREQTLKTGNPTLSMLAVIDSDVETRLHKEYASKNVTGEWFSLSVCDIENILSSHNVVWKNSRYEDVIKTIK